MRASKFDWLVAIVLFLIFGFFVSLFIEGYLALPGAAEGSFPYGTEEAGFYYRTKSHYLIAMGLPAFFMLMFAGLALRIPKSVKKTISITISALVVLAIWYVLGTFL